MRRVLSRRIIPNTPPVEKKKDYLCVEFSGTGTGHIHTVGDGPGTDGTKPYYMKYLMMSRDGIHWETTTQMRVPAGSKVYIKGKGTSFYNPSTRRGWRFHIETEWHSGSTDRVYATLSGNIMSLFYDDDFEDKTEVGDYAFYMLFYGESTNHDIVDVSRLRLPATTVGQYAYATMFYGNNKGDYAHPFTKPPKLPATTLGAHCYEGMFGYSRIDEMPELPATTLAEWCYYKMFQGCSIKEAKVLPATTLAPYCYQYMFVEQKTDIHIPHNMLPATTLAEACYVRMFSGSRITTIPSDLLPATTLANGCYGAMFADCTKLEYIPDRLLPANTMVQMCYNSMFQGCTGLTRIPRNLLHSTTLANACYQGMFKGCTGVTRIPGDLLPATRLASNCYESMFSGTQQSSISPFINGPSITMVPQGFFHATNLARYCYKNMFAGCESLTDIGSPIISENMSLADYCFEGMFCDCTALVSTDKHLIPTSTLASGCCSKMFMGCTHLTNTIKFVDVVMPNCYGHMYDGCTALTDFEELPATTLMASCYLAMFKGCGFTTLEGKSLKSTDVSSSSYQSMFENCVELETVPADFIQAGSFRGSYCCAAMFMGCKKLSVAPYLKPMNTTDPKALIVGACAFKQMFANCCNSKVVDGKTVYTGLTNMASIVDGEPARLPFTWSTMESFMWMFSGCKAMTEIPLIDVEFLEGTGAFEEMYNECYSLEVIPRGMFTKILKRGVSITDCGSFALGMFQYCKKLKTVPANLISEQTITDGGYSSMFKGCESLETPITLPSVSNSYNYMYRDCTSLKSIATIDANLAGYYSYMYQGCTNLTTVDNLPNLTSTSTKIKDFTGFFKDCTSLTSVPTVQGTDVRCSEMFSGCTALTSVALNLTFSESNASVAGSCYQMFYDTHTGGTVHSNLTRVTGTITINSIVGAIGNKGQFECMFQNCITLEALPTFTVNTTTAGANCYKGMFAGCKVLPTVQKALTSGITTLAPYCYQSMYIGCSAITAIPDGTLPATTAVSRCYEYMFSATGITEVKDGAIALTRMANACCSHMFYNCKALTKAYVPDKVETSCYEYMFSGCTVLAEIHCLINIPTVGTSYTLNWTTDVAAQGVFYRNKTAYWARGNHGIPKNWTVIDVIV